MLCACAWTQEELDKQNPVIDDIDTQLNKVTSQLKTNNTKLKGLITQVGRGWAGVSGGFGQFRRLVGSRPRHPSTPASRGRVPRLTAPVLRK